MHMHFAMAPLNAKICKQKEDSAHSNHGLSSGGSVAGAQAVAAGCQLAMAAAFGNVAPTSRYPELLQALRGKPVCRFHGQGTVFLLPNTMVGWRC